MAGVDDNEVLVTATEEVLAAVLSIVVGTVDVVDSTPDVLVGGCVGSVVVVDFVVGVVVVSFGVEVEGVVMIVVLTVWEAVRSEGRVET